MNITYSVVPVLAESSPRQRGIRRAWHTLPLFLRQYHGLAHAETEKADEETDEANLAVKEPERAQTCRFCAGDMHLTGSTDRPRVSEILEMPLSHFRQAQAGFTVTLGDRLPHPLLATAHT